MKRTDNYRGFSVVEALVALGFVAIIAGAGVSFISYSRNFKNRSNEICRLHVANVIENFRSVGYFSAVNNFIPVGANRVFLGTTQSSLAQNGIPDALMWPTNLDVLSTSSAPALNNSVLIRSSLNALLAIYNSSPAYCSSGAPYVPTGVPNAFTLPSSDLKNANLKIQILPYNTATGAMAGCPSPLQIAPEPIYKDSSPNSSYSTTPAKATKGNTQNQMGLLVRLVETFTTEDGTNGSCATEQKFQYAADTVAPRPPDFISMSGPSTNNCGGTSNTYIASFGYQNYDIEAGSVLVCRDTSVNTLAGIAGVSRVTSCSGAGAPAGNVIAYNLPPFFTPPAGKTGISYSTAYNTNVSNASIPWVPCDRVTACGVAPTSAQLTVTSTTARPQYQLTYKNLPALCRVNIEIAALDTASNSSDNTLTASHYNLTSNSNDLKVFETSDTKLSWDIPGTCGSSCGSCGTNCGVTYANVYFRCGGCP